MRFWIGLVVLTLLGYCGGVKDPELEKGDLEIVGYGDDCDDHGSLCDTKIGLVCSPIGQCECDITRNLYFVPSVNKCAAMKDEDESDETQGNDDQLSVESEENKQDDSTKDEELDSLEADNKADETPKVSEVKKPSATESKPSEEPKPVSTNKVEDKKESNKVPETGVDNEVAVDWKDISDDDSVWTLPEKCTMDADCQNSSMGKYSACDTMTNSCECFDTDGTGKDVGMLGDKCVLEKVIGEPCEDAAECRAFIQGDSTCHFDMDRNTKYCACGSFSIWDDELEECLALGVNGTDSVCKRDYQCSDKKALGHLSTCSKLTGLCECTNALVDEGKNVMFYKFMCVEEKQLGEYCEISQECEASLGLDSYCDPESFTCQCKPGVSCTQMFFGRFSYEQPQVSAFTLVTLGFLGVAVMMAGVFCIVNYVKKDEPYLYVRQVNEVV